MNVMVQSGKGKVHAGDTRQTLCSRDLGPFALITESDVDCKTCLSRQATNRKSLNMTGPDDLDLYIESLDVRQSDVLLFTGKVRHGAVKAARDARRAAMKVRLLSL